MQQCSRRDVKNSQGSVDAEGVDRVLCQVHTQNLTPMDKEEPLVCSGREYLSFGKIAELLFETYHFVVSAEAGDFAPCCPVPDKDGLIESCCDQVTLVDGQSPDALLVSRQCVHVQWSVQ